MRFTWSGLSRNQGVIVVSENGGAVVLEFNEFLGRIADQRIGANDTVISHTLTDSKRRRAGDLRLFGMVRSGKVRTDDLPRRYPEGVLASGATAYTILRALENRHDPDAEHLLRSVSHPVPVILSHQMLRAATACLTDPPDELPRPFTPPKSK